MAKFSLTRNIFDYGKVRDLLTPIIRGKKIFLANEKREYLNIGCGKNIFDWFYNLDYYWYPGIHACWDLKDRLPFPDNSFLGCYTEHCFEHLSLPIFRQSIHEVFRVLRPGACFRVVVPDAELYLRGYAAELQGTSCEIPYRNKEIEKTALMSLNRMFRGFGHQYAWDFATIKVFLEEAGFVEIEKMAVGKGRDMRLLVDTESRASESLYVEAVKP